MDLFDKSYNHNNVETITNINIGLVNEFIEALREEIKAIKKQSSSESIPLIDGFKINNIVSTYLYQFSIESRLNIPDDAPVKLEVNGELFDASIVSLSDSIVILSVEHDLGRVVSKAFLVNDMSFLLICLLKRLESKLNEKNFAGLRMLGIIDFEGEPNNKVILKNQNLYENQKKAIYSALGRNVTYIWGPPGTGKTTTIGGIIETLYEENRTALVVSHTNNAVDEAIVKISRGVGEQILKEGSILRLGQTKNDELVNKYNYVLSDVQIDIKTKDLRNRANEIKEIKEEVKNDILKINKKIEKYRWMINFKDSKNVITSKIDDYNTNLIEYANLENECKIEYNTLIFLECEFQKSEKYFELKKIINELKYKSEELNSKIKVELEYKSRLLKSIDSLNKRYNNKERLDFLLKEQSKYLSVQSIENNSKILEEKINIIKNKIKFEDEILCTIQSRYEDSKNAIVLLRVIKKLEKPEILLKKIHVKESELLKLKQESKLLNEKYDLVSKEFDYVKNLNSELKEYINYNELLSCNEINEEIKEFKYILSKKENDLKFLYENYSKINVQIYENNKLLNTIESKLDYNPNYILSELINCKNRNRKLKQELGLCKANITNRKKYIYKKFKVMMGTDIDFKQDFNSLLEELETRYLSISKEIENLNIDEAKDDIKNLELLIYSYNNSIDEIENKISDIKKIIILNAKVVGATLTKAYLSDDLNLRQFDTVILDEASMASIPALWVAAYMSQKNIVIVGDFRQLSPIVISKDDKAKKWLGEDVFKHSKVQETYEKSRIDSNISNLENFIVLDEQRRMKAEIAKIISERYYDNILKSPGFTEEKIRKEKEFNDWGNDICADSPIVMIDTESIDAWVTAVPRGNGNSSRLNMLSATLCANLAEYLIDKYPNKNINTEIKILVISPYRAHTKLIDLLIKDNNIKSVSAGTVHSFQGSEANIVIFDLVADEPHWRVGMFISILDENYKRMFNVAITRAEYKLFIVGDFKYCMSKGKRSELGELLNYMLNIKKFPKIEAKTIFPNLFKQLINTQKAVIGINEEAQYDDMVANGEMYYKYLYNDFEKAKKTIVIYAPFIEVTRSREVLTYLQSALNNGIKVYVFTKSPKEFKSKKLTTFSGMVNKMRKMGIKVINKYSMHEKAVFIDDDIIWTGTLNTLSFSSNNPTTEYMERRKSKVVFDSFAKYLNIEDIFDIVEVNKDICSKCGAEVELAEGKHGQYWRCSEGCFTSDIKQIKFTVKNSEIEIKKTKNKKEILNQQISLDDISQ